MPRIVLLANAALIFAPACGKVSDSTLPVAGAPGDAMAVSLDTANCAARRIADCQGVKNRYSSGDLFDDAP